VLAKLSRNEYFGEIALLSPELKEQAILPANYPVNRRTATVRALDDLEVVQIRGDAIRRLLEKWPNLKQPLIEQCRLSLAGQSRTPPPLLGPYLSEGLYQGQQMLVLDLESCTRCDECTRACAEAHGDGHSRLLREGPRFGRFLVATSCRSCHTPYCMESCPVDAIHRGATSLEVRIDPHCIGCGLCARNCPYESIQMTPRENGQGDSPKIAAVSQHAVNCDLCQGLVRPGAEPFCVSACPHASAHRWTGDKLYGEVTRTPGQR
jgi:Fe-S-cluster-containing dehydrogenase component